MLTSGIELMDGRDLWTDLKSIPKKTGVYSWYRRLSLDGVSPATFKATLAARMHANKVLPTFVGITGPYAVGLQPGLTKLSKKKLPLAKRAGRLVASSGSAQRIGALTLLAISAARLTANQNIEDHVPDQQKVAYKKIVKAFESVVQAEEEEEEEEEAIEEAAAEDEEPDEEDIEEDDEDETDPVDRRSLARSRLLDVLRWVKDQQQTVKPKKKKN